MSVGLGDFDPEMAAQNVAAVGQPVLTQPPPFDPAAVPQAPVAAPPAPAAVPEVTAPARSAVAPPEVQKEAESELGPEPKKPARTGDPAKDVQADVDYTRQIQDRHDALLKKQGEIQQQNAAIESAKATREAAEEKRAQEARAKQQEEYQARRAQRQSEIDQAVTGRAAAMKDLSNAGKDETFGLKLGRSIAIALGGIGQALMLKGHVAGAQNEGLKAVNDTMAQDYQRRKDRLAAASDAVMEARYGFKDAADNHRAAMNDLDADTAAKYRLIAKEADAQLRRQGAPDAAIKSNLVILDAQQKAAAAEAAIDQREEEMGVHRETAAATNAMAGAHLNLAERQAQATENQRHETNAEARERIKLAREEAAIRDADRREAMADRKNAAKARAIPTVLTDSLTGKDLPVDPDRTNSSQHATAVAGLPQVNGAIQILDTVLEGADNPHAPEWLGVIGVDTSPQAKLNAMMKRFRSAYAASKKESVGEANAHELAEAIPDPPSNIRLGSAAFDNWKKKIEDTRSELHDTRRGLLANAGVAPTALTSANDELRAAAAAADKKLAPAMVTVRNAKTGETKQVTREEAQRIGAL